MKRINCAAAMAALVLAMAACAERNAVEPDGDSGVLVPGRVVSNPLSGTRNATIASGFRGSLAVANASLVFVSAAPGTYPDGVQAEIGNVTTPAGSQTVRIVNGGFDPVGVEAKADEVLGLTITNNHGGSTAARVTVPRRRKPEVVRTSPAKGRTDVALNVLIEIIFSEPIQTASVNSSSLKLLSNGVRVDAEITLSADGLRVEVLPAGGLKPDTNYSLDIGTDIKDLDGDALSSYPATTFKTVSEESIGALVVTTTTSSANPDNIDGDGYRVSINGAAAQPIEVNGNLTLPNLSAGNYAIELSDVSGNCTVTGNRVRSAVVTAKQTTTIAFDITCQAPAVMAGVLAFVSERDGNSEIYSVNVDGSDLKRLTKNEADDVDPAWSPDGTRIAFTRGKNEATNIFVMDADGSNVVQLTTSGLYNEMPSWSPDGKSIAFSSLRNGQFGIYVMGLSGDIAGARSVGYDAGYQVDPAWSPDGKSIAFTSDARAYDFLFDIYIADADGSNIRLVINGPFFWVDGLTFFFEAAWSPDGKKLAVVKCAWARDNCFPESSIAVANADGSGLTTLVGTAGYARPAWSPDGSMIAYSYQPCRSCESSIRYVTADGRASGLILEGGRSPSWRH